NFKYRPMAPQFANMCAIISPKLYCNLTKHLPLPTLQHLRYELNLILQLPLSICECTFLTVVQYLQSVGYSAPVALSCDDTKLHLAYRTYWDTSKQIHMLVGGTSEPRVVTNPDELQELLEDLTSATKVCTFLLPKMPPIVIAAKAIPNSLSVTDLHKLIIPIIWGLLAHKVAICSYACDGTQTE
ncbi:hypothetical protein GY45DRAFT_1263530, partial [Cubamyces sp. BRFM 1775]